MILNFSILSPLFSLLPSLQPYSFLLFLLIITRTKDDTELLVYSDELDWSTIAYEQFSLEHSAFDCCIHFKNDLQPAISHKKWTATEARKVQEIAKRHELRDWETIATELNTGRTAIQCLKCYLTSCNILSRK